MKRLLLILLLGTLSPAQDIPKPVKAVRTRIKGCTAVTIGSTEGQDFTFYFAPSVQGENIKQIRMAAYFPKLKIAVLYDTELDCKENTLRVIRMTGIPGNTKEVNDGFQPIVWRSPASYIRLKVCTQQAI